MTAAVRMANVFMAKLLISGSLFPHERNVADSGEQLETALNRQISPKEKCIFRPETVPKAKKSLQSICKKQLTVSTPFWPNASHVSRI